MSAAVIGGLIAAGGSVAAAEIGTHSAGEAVDAQTRASNQALALQGQIYNQTRNDYAPYRDLATGSLAALRNYAGAPVIRRGPSGGYQPGFQPGMTLGGMAPGLGGEQGMVTLRAPNGATKAVPQADVEHYLKLGAVRV